MLEHTTKGTRNTLITKLTGMLLCTRAVFNCVAVSSVVLWGEGWRGLLKTRSSRGVGGRKRGG